MDLREIVLGSVDWIRLAQDRDRWRAVLSAVMNLRVLAPPSLVILRIKFFTLSKVLIDDQQPCPVLIMSWVLV
jgi:hypothetical protein